MRATVQRGGRSDRHRRTAGKSSGGEKSEGEKSRICNKRIASNEDEEVPSDYAKKNEELRRGPRPASTSQT